MATATGELVRGAVVATVEPRRGRRLDLGVALVALAALLFLGFGARTIAAPFGDSHDGRNGGVWAAGSRSLREHGPVESRLGTRSAEIGVYANHPPLIYVETALAELVGFHTAAATRAPAWIGSLLVIVLLARLLRDRGLRSNAAGTAVLLVATTPMFLVFGTMLDTPVTSLAFGVALLLLWERARRGERVRPAVACALAALSVLAGWQALTLSVAIGGWAAVRLVQRTGRRNVDLAFAGGTVAGGVLLLAWLLWAFGGTLRPLFDQFVVRTGQSTVQVPLDEVLAAQRRDALAMFGAVALLAGGGLVAAFRDQRTRGLAALAVAVTLPYPFVFRSGAVNHAYWNYWFLLPLAIGLAVVADRLLDYWRSRHRRESVLLLGAVGLAALPLVCVWAATWPEEAEKVGGFEAGAVAEDAALGPAQQQAWFAGAVGQTPSWLGLVARRPPVFLAASQYVDLASSHPGDLVFVGEVRCVAGADDWTYGLRTAASLVDRPPDFMPCGRSRR